MKKRIMFKVEKNRVLVPVGEPCPFGCRYCYTRGGEVGLSRVDPEEVLTQFDAFAHEAAFDTIQFGYDGDPFARPERGIAMLGRLATYGKDVNFSTKGAMNATTLEGLAAIQSQMEAYDTTLSALVSVSCWDSAPLVEPHTPSPAERMQTVASLKRLGIPVFIAVRPILPHIPDLEYERLVAEALLAGCDGFVLGPLYVDDRGQFARFIPPEVLTQVPSRRATVSWSAHAPEWTRYEDEARLQRLATFIEKKEGTVYTSSADAMAGLSQRRAVA
ncbi:hypothetical protein KSC_065960 [Ktedonobacter sp. SOSP1-52]|uniref:radical SAM protein n=1 Tax=Ktedonobacter sp. SOSP1-52 TaxID=2778366 RepID=UPI00191535FD|nr:radical SAM protein [Ktedonobacter sp. SOSP1-52]GHO67704.1 hypothetical protein KSC_065960 [Ktedonobacter sp. SOSP1-52]